MGGVTFDGSRSHMRQGLKRAQEKEKERDSEGCLPFNYNRDVCHLLHSRTLSLSHTKLIIKVCGKYIYIYTLTFGNS